MATFHLLPLAFAQPPPDIFVPPGGTGVLRCEFTGQTAFPGDTVYCDLRIGLLGDVDASFFVYVDPSSIKVSGCQPVLPNGTCGSEPEIPPNDPRYAEFRDWWSFSAITRPVITRSLPADHDVTYDPRPRVICEPRLLTQVTASNPCPLGVIRGISSPRNSTDRAEPAYERQYRFGMTEADTGEDQSWAAGWSLRFDLVIRGMIPAQETCPTARVNGICSTPIYERP